MGSIPMVAQQMALILEIQTNEFWQDVTTPMLENVRKKLRGLMNLIERRKRNQIYTDFEDEIGPETEIEFAGVSTVADYEQFKAKTLQFLKDHEDDTVIHKLRFNEPLTPADLNTLETMLVEAGTGSPGDVARAKVENLGLGLFVRSLVGLDREAAKQAFGSFLLDKTLSANQIEFINLVIDHLTQRGWMEASALYESPFIDLNPYGVDGLFPTAQAAKLVSVLSDIRTRAAA
jgi:type I restriction enzyme, R subunit